MATTTEITTSVRNSSGSWEVIDREPVELLRGLDLSDVEVFAEDLGGEVGQIVKVALVDSEDREVRSVEVETK